MKRILIGPAPSLTINDIVDPGQEFEVHSGLVWVDAPDDVSSNTHEWDGAAFLPKSIPPLRPDKTFPEFIGGDVMKLRGEMNALVAKLRELGYLR